MRGRLVVDRQYSRVQYVTFKLKGNTGKMKVVKTLVLLISKVDSFALMKKFKGPRKSTLYLIKLMSLQG